MTEIIITLYYVWQRILEQQDTFIVLIGTTSRNATSFIPKYERCINLMEKTTIKEVISLFSISRVLISNASGIVHMASLTDIYIIALFAPETPLLYYRDKKDKINNPISQLKLFKSYFKNPQDFIKKMSCNVLNDSAFTVSPDGSVNLCPYMRPIGNIREGNLQDIWYSKEAHKRREEILQCKKIVIISLIVGMKKRPN